MPKGKPKHNARGTISCPGLTGPCPACTGLTGPCPACTGLSVDVRDQKATPSGQHTPKTGARSKGAGKKRSP